MEPWKTEAHEQNRTVLHAAAVALAAYVGGGYDTVGEGILYPFMLDLFAEACEPQGIAFHYAVLCAPVLVVQDRVQSRRVEPEHFGALADKTVVDDLWQQFEAHGIDERHRVDIGDDTPEKVAAEIDRRWSAGGLRLSP